MSQAHASHSFSTVTRAVAHHLGMQPEDVGEELDLREDLGLDALDLVLIVTRVEEDLLLAVSLPQLDYVRTVADLAAVVDDGTEPPTLRDPTAWDGEDAHPA
jgi:acyl carrier protein